MNTAAIIVAAGRGQRAGGDLPKQYQPLAGAPVLARTIAAFARHPAVGEIIVVTAPDDAALFARLIPPPKGVAFRRVDGGATRDASVRAGLEATRAARVLIHDGARPLVSQKLIDAVIAALEEHDGAAPALAISDALWRCDDGRIIAPVPRAGLWRAQTPQGFGRTAILAAHAAHTGDAADDVEAALAAGLDVACVPGDEANLKITWPQDFRRAAQLLEHRMDIRTGNGFDVHAFGAGDAVTLCGVRLPHSHGLVGHSDADVGMHALTDAIYGALAEGDIGRHFPPSEARWKDAGSDIFLRHAMERARARGFELSNADVTLICEAPRIAPHAEAMRTALAAIMEVTVERVSVKATTSERLGFAGRGEGIAALATATLVAP